MQNHNLNFKITKFKTFFLPVVFSVFYFLFFVVGYTNAVGASLYLTPSSGSFLVGSTFTVSVFVNSQDNNINVVWAELKFPADKLQVASPIAGLSMVGEWLTPPRYSNQKGIVDFRGGIPEGITTSAGLISTITFRAVSAGKAKIEFGDASGIFLADGQGTDILEQARGGEYHILTPPPEGPQIFSSTHPDFNQWYPDSIPSFSWDKGQGVTDFSWSFNQSPFDRPDGIGEGSETIASFKDIQDGVWHFHLRQQKNGVWGKTSHQIVKIDTNPPQEFSPRLEINSALFGNQIVVHFEAQDILSGIDYYQVKVSGLGAANSMPSFFIEAVSPYKLPIEESGQYSVIIRAVDKAGNIREEEIKFRQIFSFLFLIGGRGFVINGIFVSWSFCLILLLILTGLFLGIKWLKNRNKARIQQIQ